MQTVVLRVMLIGALLGIPIGAMAQTEQVEYYGLDAVGSVRIVFDANGVVQGRMDYAPFGEELYSGLFMPSERFAQLTRDGEAGLDYAQARMYQLRTGRFNSPDPIFAALFDPQRLNRYGYAINRPLTYTDSSGLDPILPTMALGIAGMFDSNRSTTVTGTAGSDVVFWMTRQPGGTGLIDLSNAAARFAIGLIDSALSPLNHPVANSDLVPTVSQKEDGGTLTAAASILVTIAATKRLPKAAGRLFGHEARDLFGETAFGGLIQNRALRGLTDVELRAAFQGTPFTLSNHAVSRLLDPRTEGMGYFTLNHIALLLRNGTLESAGDGLLAIRRNGFEAIVDPRTGLIVTFRPF